MNISSCPELITDRRTFFIRKRIQTFIISEALKRFHNPLKAFKEMWRLKNLRDKAHGSSAIKKYARVGNRYFWNTDYCGFPSENLKSVIHSEFLRNSANGLSGERERPALQTLIWGITNRCPLSCRHCYEWDNIAHSDTLGLDQLKYILEVFKTHGLRHIQFSGGEPLARFNDLTVLIREASPTMDCWLLTSGFGLTEEKAVILKQAGLTGANISLDHWDAPMHNAFRNNEKSFSMVEEAVGHCLRAGLLVSLSLCATREFVTEENLEKYASLARDLGVQFIRILEPRATGKFAGTKVTLDKSQVELLSRFSIRMNNHPVYRDYPIVAFFGYHQRLLGCFGAGNRYAYADPNGDMHACPFCRGTMGNILEEPFSDILDRVKGKGCHNFPSFARK